MTLVHFPTPIGAQEALGLVIPQIQPGFLLAHPYLELSVG